MNNWIQKQGGWKEVVKDLFAALIISTFIVGNLWAIYSLKIMLGRMDRKIEMHEIQHNLDIRDLLEMTEKGLNIVRTNETYQQVLTLSLMDVMQELTDNMSTYQDVQNTIQKKLDSYQTIDNNLSEILKEANILLCNVTKGCSGSGTHIKINGQSYILTCAHLMDDIDDKVAAVLDTEDICPLQLAKVNKDLDLALFKIYDDNNLAYLEIGTEEPKVGSQVFTVGNPNVIIDVVTEGVIAKIEKESYLITNIIYFGSSGGALVYKNKLIGVVNELCTYNELGATVVNYGSAVKLEAIQAFIGSYKSKVN